VQFAASYIFLTVIGATMLVPLLWMLKTSLQPPTADVMQITPLLPEEYRFANYSQVIDELDFSVSIWNSVLVTGLTTIGLVFTSSLAAFAFARLSFFGRNQIFFGYLATLMIPSAVTMIPVFILLRELGWVNTYYALIIPPMFSAYGVFMLRQFFLAIPRELEEAAIIDGCTTFGVYWRIVLPLAKPALAALTILTFMGSWRSFMWPLIVTHSKEMATLPVALTQFTEMFSVRWNLLMAGSVIMVLPMMIVFVIGQRFFIEGIQLGAVKG
jgi:multiple sugar transport system permease protein